jgi:hypothetical protein
MTPALYLKFGAATAADELHLEEVKACVDLPPAPASREG